MKRLLLKESIDLILFDRCYHIYKDANENICISKPQKAILSLDWFNAELGLIGNDAMTEKEFEEFLADLDVYLVLKFQGRTEDTIGETMQILRKMKGLSQKELSNLCGIPIGSIKQYETDRRHPKFENLLAISNILGKSLLEKYYEKVTG